MVALELYRSVTVWNDMVHGRFSLHFIKNKEKEKGDFLISMDHAPFLLIEAKLSVKDPPVALKKFQRMLKIPAVQLTMEGNSFELLSNNDQSILIAPASKWLSRLP